MVAMQNSMVEMMNSPDINTNIPAVKVIPVKMSLYKLFDLFLLPPKGLTPFDKEPNVRRWRLVKYKMHPLTNKATVLDCMMLNLQKDE